MPNVSAYRPDYLFQTLIRVCGSHPNRSCLSKDLRGWTTDKGIGKWSHAGLCLLEDIDSLTRRFRAVLSRDLVAHERVYPLHIESQQSHEVAYGRCKSNEFVLKPLNFADDIV